MAKKKDTKIKMKITPEMLESETFDQVDVADISEEWVKIFASNVNIARITPHLIDSLKPVGRRLLYAMHLNPDKGKDFRKVVRVASDTIQFHPHGDTSVSDVVYKYGQPWRNNIPLLDSQGNFGNIRGLEPAHPRYPECRLSRAAEWIFFSDMKDANVPMRRSYDGKGSEPDYLPARIPLVLINPAFSSIGIGAATNIPPFNVSDVLRATIKLLENPNAKIRLIPDSPTGCNIIDDGQFDLMNEIGEGCTLTMEATYEIDYIRNIVSITSIPMHQTTDAVTAKLISMKKAGQLDELIDIADDSKLGNVDYKIMLKSDANPDKFITKILKKKTGLRETFPVKIRVVDNFRAHVWGTRETLLKWIAYRQECVRATYNKKLIDVINANHMNDVYLMVFAKDNIKRTMEISRKSRNKEECIKAFMDTYKISSVQAKTLSEMRVYQFNQDAYEGYQKAKEVYAKEIKEYENVITSDEAVDRVIKDQLLEADRLFGAPRKSAVIKAGKAEAKIPDTMHLVGISRDGYIKKLSLTTATSIGVVGKSSQVIVTHISNRDNLLIFGDDGRMSRVGVSSIPDMGFDEIGVELNRYFTLTGSPVSVLNEMDVQNGAGDIVIITKKGLGKRTKMSEFAKIRDFKDCISLNEGDELVTAVPAGDEEFIIYTNFGDGIRLSTTSIKYQGRNAKGLQLISLRKGEAVVGIDFMENDTDQIVYVTSSGRLKLTDSKFFPLMERKSEPLALVNLETNETLVGVGFVSDKDMVEVYRRKSGPVTIPVSMIPSTTRVAKPTKMVKTPSGDTVIAFRIIRK